jgi:diguanylate cyclase (GGDEF)-like protein
VGRSEVSYLTQVFNHMVANLRRGREELSAANDALLQTNRELEQLSIIDDLTGLFNRKKIMEQFHSEVVRARRSESPLAVLMLDIDHFKETNDTYGHQVGDVVLTQLAESLLDSVRECDFVGRYGGEEFLLLLPDSSTSDGITTAERIQDHINDLSIEAGSETITVSVSIGVSEFPKDGLEVASVLRMADDALYCSKDNGRNQITVAANPIDSGQDKSLPQLHLIG